MRGRPTPEQTALQERALQDGIWAERIIPEMVFTIERFVKALLTEIDGDIEGLEILASRGNIRAKKILQQVLALRSDAKIVRMEYENEHSPETAQSKKTSFVEGLLRQNAGSNPIDIAPGTLTSMERLGLIAITNPDENLTSDADLMRELVIRTHFGSQRKAKLYIWKRRDEEGRILNEVREACIVAS